ncbi:MAG: iron-containing alcohol dehydrogenase, partial [Acholeplasmatales bacterium]|nr:iron-containing alcohol dehydrogenase [Acholeplasmatales bacterium]
GKDSINNLTDILSLFGKNVLITYGGGSIKKIRLYDKVKSLLKDKNIYELSGIEPNPKYNPSVLDGVKICKDKKIDVVLSVGGGSVLDCSKAICAGACYDGDPWDLITYKASVKKALPLVDIITLAATGSEYDNGAVISRTETNDKMGFCSDLLFPYASIIDPVYTFTVSPYQTAAGAIDAINHVMEAYFAEKHSTLMDGMSEACIKSIIKYTPIALKNPNDYNARAEIMLSATLACNGILSLGNSSSGWPMHAIEHALSAYFDITHGVGLGIITPRWMKYVLSDKTINRFVSFGTHVFDIDSSLSKEEIAKETICKVYDIFASFNIPMTLTEVGIKESDLKEIAHHIAINEGLDKAWAPLNENDILNILKDCL